MRLLWTLGALCLCLGLVPAAHAAETSAEIGARLSQQATAFLEQLLGPGRGRALVRVEAESSHGHSDFELTAPAPLDQVAAPASLPGYVPTAKQESSKRTITSHQVADWDRDMQIKSLHVTAILDTRVDAAAVAEVKRVLPQFLQMDGDRGDDLVVVQAPLRPAWRQLLEDPRRWRLPVLILLVILPIFAMVLIASASLVHSARSLAKALERRAAPVPREELPGFEPLPTLEGEVVSGLPEPMSEGSAQAAMLALGRHFDFLTGRDPALVSRVLAEQRSDDLAQLFAHLAGADPDLSALLFSALPFPRQSEVSQRLAGIRTAEPDRLSEIEARLRALVDNAVPGPERLGAILSRLPADKRQELLADVGTARPDAVQEVERSVFGFEDLARLSVVDLRRLLSSVPYEEWAVALFGADPVIVRALLAELPPETADAVREGASTPPSPARVMAARSRVLGMARSLLEGGRVPGGAGLG